MSPIAFPFYVDSVSSYQFYHFESVVAGTEDAKQTVNSCGVFDTTDKYRSLISSLLYLKMLTVYEHDRNRNLEAFCFCTLPRQIKSYKHFL